MNATEANERRLIAAEIIRSLWESKYTGQLDLLRIQVDISLKDLGAATPTPDAGEEAKELLIIDAAVEVAVFSKTHEWPKECSPDFFKFAQLLDDLATKIQARYPEFNKNVRAAKSNSPSAGDEGGKS